MVLQAQPYLKFPLDEDVKIRLYPEFISTDEALRSFTPQKYVKMVKMDNKLQYQIKMNFRFPTFSQTRLLL